MMTRIILLAAVLNAWAWTASAKQGWVVGENYLARWSDSAPPVIQAIGYTTSWNIDKAGCRVGFTDESAQLFLADWSGELRSVPLMGRLVSDLSDGYFYSVQGDRLSRHDREGALQGSFTLADGNSLERMVELRNGKFLGLFYRSEENRIWVRKFDGNFALLQEIPIATAYAVWANPQLLLDGTTEGFWVGYSASTPKYAYTPYVTRFNAEGKRTELFQWDAKGLFFDFCTTKDGLLMSRDLPSYPYTVPVYSFLESLVPGANPQTVHEVETNYFVDHLLCEDRDIWMVQRSIFGSDGSYLVRWDSKGPSEKLARLPGPARSFHACSTMQ